MNIHKTYCSIVIATSLTVLCSGTAEKAVTAVTEGNYQRIQQLIQQENVDPNTTGKFERTLLHIAAEHNHVEISKLLLDNNANPNAQPDREKLTSEGPITAFQLTGTPLHIASRLGHEKIVRQLLAHNAEVNVFDVIARKTPLYEASRSGYEHIVNMLLTHGADPNITSTTTPLYVATEHGYARIAELLLQYNANPDVGYQQKIYLPGTADQVTAVPISEAPLHTALERDNDQMAILLLRYQADPRIIDAQEDKTPLRIAYERGNVRLIMLLLQYEAYPYKPPHGEMDPLEHVLLQPLDEEDTSELHPAQPLLTFNILSDKMRNSLIDHTSSDRIRQLVTYTNSLEHGEDLVEAADTVAHAKVCIGHGKYQLASKIMQEHAFSAKSRAYVMLHALMLNYIRHDAHLQAFIHTHSTSETVKAMSSVLQSEIQQGRLAEPVFAYTLQHYPQFISDDLKHIQKLPYHMIYRISHAAQQSRIDQGLLIALGTRIQELQATPTEMHHAMHQMHERLATFQENRKTFLHYLAYAPLYADVARKLTPKILNNHDVTFQRQSGDKSPEILGLGLHKLYQINSS